MSRGISGGKQVIKFANISNRGRLCLFSQNKTTIFNLQNAKFEFRQVLSHKHSACCEAIYSCCRNQKVKIYDQFLQVPPKNLLVWSLR